MISQEWEKDRKVFTNNHISVRFAEHIIRTGYTMFEIQLMAWDMRNNMAGLNPFIYHLTFLFIIRRKTQLVPHIAYQNTVQMPHTVVHSKRKAKNYELIYDHKRYFKREAQY